VKMLVVPLADIGVHDNGVILGRNEVAVSRRQERANNPLQLPGSRGAGRVPGLPGDVILRMVSLSGGKASRKPASSIKRA
ncbi:MAG: hypothetical protein ACUVTV_08475, partial [Anaerolineae bacterium]